MNQSILIVDDIKANIDMISNVLRQDYMIMAAISGENALKILARKKPDLVLLDVFMPGMDGFEVLRRMQADATLAAIPVIFVTGEHDEQIEVKGLSMGAVDYIKKPFNATVIRYKVRNQLSFKTYRDELEVLVEKRTAQLMASREAIIMGMSLMSETHDQVTSAHIERIKLYTQLLTQQLLADYPQMLTPELAEQIVLYAPLHDLGKIEIPDTILSNPGTLTPEEFKIMQNHTHIGADLLHKTASFIFDKADDHDLNVAIEIAENHHERFDGSGYPRGLVGEAIPVSSRIVALADTYDGLRNNKPYKKAYTHEQAVNIILRGGENITPAYFDPRVLDAFDKVKDQFEI